MADQAVPPALSREMIAEHTRRDQLLGAVVRTIQKEEVIGISIDQFHNIMSELSVTHDGMLLRGDRIVIPSSLHQRVIRHAHRGHPGIVRTKQLLRSRCWFPSMDTLVEKLVKTCIPCQATVPTKQRDPIQSTPLPQRAWYQLSIDFMGPFPDNKYVLAVMDEYSRYPLTEVVLSTSAASTIKVLRKWFTQFGVPQELKSDNGPPFQSREYAFFLQELGIHAHRVTPYWPEANGGSERFFRTIKKVIQAAVLERKDWQQELDMFLLNYRATPHATIKTSPAALLFAYPFSVGFLPIIGDVSPPEALAATDAAGKAQQQKYANNSRNTQPHGLVNGDSVLVKQPASNKLTPAYDPQPFQVTEVKGNQITAERDGKQIIRNSSFFKKIPQFEDSANQTVGSPSARNSSLPQSEPSVPNCLESAGSDPAGTTTTPVSKTPEVHPPSPTTPQPRRSSRVVQAPAKFKDFVFPGKGGM